MKSNNVIAILVLVAILFAGLHVLGQLTGSAVTREHASSDISSLDHTMPPRPDAQPGFDASAPGVAPGPTWGPAAASAKAAAQKSIKGQLDAFKQDDYYKAVYYQSSQLRAHFRDVASFRSMMMASYPEFARYKSVAFGAARSDSTGDSILIEATVTGKDGIVQHALYTMIKEQNVYRVSSVTGGQIAPPPISRRNELSL